MCFFINNFKKQQYIILLIFIAFISCSESNTESNNNSVTSFGIFKVINDSTVEMNGEINSNTLADFNRLIQNYPNIKLINTKEVPGSSDDQVNLQVSKRVFDLGIATHLMDNGEIASGGVDFFIAGVKRTIGANTKIGVHSWSDGSQDATAFPVGHANHLPYINYYISVGFTQQQAENFYYFTINAAPASSIHWMTEAEIIQYGLIKN